VTLAEIADRLAIDDLLTRYAFAVDAKDWDLYASCFTTDARIDYTASGGIAGTLPEVRAWLAEVMDFFPICQHVVANRTIVVAGDSATSRSYLFNPMVVGERETGGLFLEGGVYRDRIARTADGWRIAERIEEASWSTRRHAIMPPVGKG
jgi:3-phenylpropionate/cinnamic acid dioxygenase small subunit